jgi:hypothetical protein
MIQMTASSALKKAVTATIATWRLKSMTWKKISDQSPLGATVMEALEEVEAVGVGEEEQVNVHRDHDPRLP